RIFVGVGRQYRPAHDLLVGCADVDAPFADSAGIVLRPELLVGRGESASHVFGRTNDETHAWADDAVEHAELDAGLGSIRNRGSERDWGNDKCRNSGCKIGTHGRVLFLLHRITSRTMPGHLRSIGSQEGGIWRARNANGSSGGAGALQAINRRLIMRVEPL